VRGGTRALQREFACTRRARESRERVLITGSAMGGREGGRGEGMEAEEITGFSCRRRGNAISGRLHYTLPHPPPSATPRVVRETNKRARIAALQRSSGTAARLRSRETLSPPPPSKNGSANFRPAGNEFPGEFRSVAAFPDSPRWNKVIAREKRVTRGAS